MRIALLLVSIASLVFSQPSTVFAAGFVAPTEITNREKAHQNIVFTGGEEVCSEEDTGSSGSDSDVDGFLRALAHQESGGNPRAEASGSSASGKYQYIDGTWQARYDMYPPAREYNRASQAPEPVQDAVAYIEYSKKFEQYEHDLFRLALSHFYPAAITDPSLLDQLIGSNSITPREYAESMVTKVKEGVGANIPLKYTEAPEFDRYASIPSDGNTPPNPSNPPPDSEESKGVVFLDPGHGGSVPEYTDRVTGLRDRETRNPGETADVLQIARRAKSQLEADGYTVVLARTDNDTPINKRVRVNAAKSANADLAISIHTTEGDQPNQVWPQRVGKYREYNGTRVTFDDRSTAKTSDKYAKLLAQARSEAEGRPVGLDPRNTQQATSFSRGDIPSKGNISLVQLWSPTIPWIYSEYARGNNTNLTEEQKQNYTAGIVEGVKASLVSDVADDQSNQPITTDECGNETEGDTFGGGDLAETTLAYAWPTYHSPNFFEMKPAYKQAVKTAQRTGRYVGGGTRPGIDCGGFVTTLLVDSGFEPKYNHGGKMSAGAGNTTTQRAWAEANWDNLGSGSRVDTASLRPGDVAFSPGHTFVYVGRIDGFSKVIASASYSPSNTSWRTPMAGSESLTSGDVTWFRKN